MSVSGSDSDPPLLRDRGASSVSLGEREARPGLLLRHPDGKSLFKESEVSLLESRLEVKVGEDRVKKIDLSADRLQAYVELVDEADISKVLSGLTLEKAKPPLLVERFDLMEVWRPYLIARGLEEWITKDVIEEHFAAEAGGAKVESVEVRERGREAKVVFLNPQVALGFQSSTEFLGLTVELEVGYSSPAEKKDMVLAVTKLPLRIPERNLKSSLVKYFAKHSGHEAAECRIIQGVGYLSFKDASAVSAILHNPPTTKFYAGTALVLSAVPLSQMLETEEADPSTAFHRTYSSASEDSVFSITPSTSMDSQRMRRAFGRERDSVDSMASSFESQTAICDTDCSDAELSLNPSQQRLLSQSSASSDGGGIMFSPPAVPIASGALPRRDPSSSTSLTTVPEHAALPGTSPRKPDLEDMSLQDMDGPAPFPSSHDYTTKVLVQDVPTSCRDWKLIKYYIWSLISVECDVKKYEGGRSFLATFKQPINFQMLKETSRSKPMESYFLSFINMSDSANKKVLITLSHHNEQIMNEIVVRLHFESFTGRGSVEEVKILPPDKACITFKDPQSVKVVMNNQECQKLEGNSISIEEYYDFMTEDVDTQVEEIVAAQALPQQPTTRYVWRPNEQPLEEMKATWLQGKLQELNGKLASVNAEASVTKSRSGSPSLKIKPLGGSEGMDDWDTQVMSVLDTFSSSFKEDSLALPNSCYEELKRHAQSAKCADLVVSFDGNAVILAGDSATLDKVMAELQEMIKQLEVYVDEQTFERKHVKYLKKFCESRLKLLHPPVQYYDLDPDQERIEVRATREAGELFWATVKAELDQKQEKELILTPEAFRLLASDRGVKKIEEAIGTAQIEYDLLRDSGTHVLYMCSPLKGVHLKNAKEALKKYTEKDVVDIQNPRFCSDVKWKEHVQKLENDVFVMITVDNSSKKVLVIGEKIVVSSVVQNIKHFLSEQTRIKEEVSIPGNKWNVIFKSFASEMEACRLRKDVEITYPRRPMRDKATVVIKGEPVVVDRVKGEIEALVDKVCHKEVKLCNIPAAVQVVNSMEDKIRVLENTHEASIDVSLIPDDSAPAQAPSQKCMPLFKADSGEARVFVYNGDFTKHDYVDAVVNFVPSKSSAQDDNLNLKHLFAAGGATLKQDFMAKMAQFLKQNPGDIFKSDHGRLLCGQLWHCFLPPWDGGDKCEEYYLDEALTKIVSRLNSSNRILFTSICSEPLKYPPKVFADKIASMITSGTSDTVAVYVNDIPQAREMEGRFKAASWNVSAPASSQPPSLSTARSISAPISSFITLVQGSLLDQQAEVYVNSTNRNLELDTGSLSKELLKACGDELQKKCSDHAPLKEQTVAITEAKNLKADFIYHVALPDYKSDHYASRKFRGTVQAILRTAKENKVKSLAFPSLGGGNLHYPASTSAKILFEEIIAFRARNRNHDITFFCVVFDKATFKDFNKEYAQRINSAPPPKKHGLRSKKDSGSTRLSVEHSDISEEETDVIVNTTTAEMKLSDSAVSKALLRKAGDLLQQTCDQLVQSGLKLDHGQIVETKSFGSLGCKKLIHAHLPPRSEASKSGLDHHALIVEIVTKCLDKAEEMGMKSISFPAFGFGQGGYSVTEVAEPMLTAFRDFGRRGPSSLEIIRVVIFDVNLHQKFFDFFVGFFKVDTSTPLKIVSGLYNMLNPRGGHGGRSVVLQDGGGSSGSTAPLSHHHTEPVGTNQLLVFNIYAASVDLCEQITTQVREVIKEKCMTNSIENPVIKNLIDADIEEIRSIGNRLQVQVSVLTQLGKVEIEGEKGQVKDAQIDIMHIMREIEKAEMELKQFQWQSENDSAEVEKYSDEDSFKLERAKAKNLRAIEIVIDNLDFVIDLDKMEEINKTTGDIRKVARVPIKPKLELPKTWEPQPCDADGKELNVHLFDVDKGSTEYQEALKRFNDTIGKPVTIISLKRIQNPIEYGRHIAIREMVARKYKKKPEVKQLFHGSVEASIEAITVQGFNRNFAGKNATYYGLGVYFALKASYSAQTTYSEPNKEGHQSIFICQMVIGEYTVGKKGLKVATHKDTNQAFDTLVEKQDNPTIFVAMSDAQAYPEYLVTFKAEKAKS